MRSEIPAKILKSQIPATFRRFPAPWRTSEDSLGDYPLALRGMAQQWYETLHVAIGLALHGDEAAVRTLGADLEAHPLLGPFAVQEVHSLLARSSSSGCSSGGYAVSPAWNSSDVARVLERLCLAAFESRKTLQALLACLRGDDPKSSTGQDALWDAMGHVEWRVKMAVAAHIILRLNMTSIEGGNVGGGNSCMLNQVELLGLLCQYLL